MDIRMPECCKIVSILSLHSENGQKCNPSDVNVCSQWHFKAVSLLYDVCKAHNNADKQIHTTTLLTLRSLRICFTALISLFFTLEATTSC